MRAPAISEMELRVLLVTPTHRDGVLTRAMLSEAGVRSELCANVMALRAELDRPTGTVLIHEEALKDGGMEALRAWLDDQPPWSDLPILLLVRSGPNTAVAEQAVARLGNVTLLERPLHVATLVTAVRTALRGRYRQYQTREHLQERARSNELLESRVAERTAVAEHRAAQLSTLARELTRAETRERRRLARVLHDHLQQLLVAARLRLGVALSRVNDDAAREPIRSADALIQESISESRSLTVELSPPILYEGGLVPALGWLARWMGDKHGLQVDLRTGPESEPAGEESRVLLFHATRELLFNVVKHARVASATVTVKREPDGGTSVRVEDAGRGFDAEADHSLTGRKDHVGLFSIRERLEALGGTLEVQSAVGAGTQITVRLPGASFMAPSASENGSDEAAPKHAPAAPSPLSTGRKAGKMTVLLADDHEILREGLAGLLREEPDVDVVGQASDGRQAVELVERLRPDVVVMDVTMPVLSGVEATRQITERWPHVRVVALSMHDHADMAAAMGEAGAAAYVTKGGAVGDLIACIRGLASAENL